MKQEYDFRKGKRGPVAPVSQGKTDVTLRLDEDILQWFRNRVDAAGGGNYQTLINLALRDFINRSQPPMINHTRNRIAQSALTPEEQGS